MFDVEAVMEANGLEFSFGSVDQNPYMPQDSDDLSHFLCTLSGGTLTNFEFYVSMGEDSGRNVPDAAFALSLLLEDVRSYRGCQGYADFARLIGIDDDDRSGEVAFEEIARLAPMMDMIAEMSQSQVSVPN